jgi:hypothetical protein
MILSFERHEVTKQFHGGVPTIYLGGIILNRQWVTVSLPLRECAAGAFAAVIDIDVLDEKGALVAIGRDTYVPVIGECNERCLPE